MDLELDGKVVVVTAAGGGIGLAVCDALVREGALVVAVSRRELPQRTLTSLSLDLTSPRAAESVVAEVTARHGRLDALVNVLGGPDASAGGFVDRDDERWQRAFEFNLLSAVRMTRACVPLMAKAASASIVNIGSDLGRQPDPDFVEYAAMKSAMLSVSKSLSIELGPQIRSNTLSPGPTRTPGLVEDFANHIAPTWGTTTEEAIDRYVNNIRRMPSGRLAMPEEVARAAVFLASPLSAPMTGAEVVIDGGTRKAA